MATPNPLPFQFSPRWQQLGVNFNEEQLRGLEDRDRQLEDFIGQDQGVLGWENVARTAGENGTTTSATFVDWPTTGPLTSEIRKRVSPSLLIVELHVAYYCSVASAQDFGVNIDGVDYLVLDCFENTGVDHTGRSGVLSIADLVAGTYTVTLRARSDGVVTLNADVNDQSSWSIRERFAG